MGVDGGLAKMVAPEVEARVVAAFRLTGFPDHSPSLSRLGRMASWDEFLDLVRPDESLQRLVMGNPIGSDDPGVLMATDIRVIWAHRALMGIRVQTKYTDFYYEDVVSVLRKPGRINVMGELWVHAKGNRSVGLRHVANLAMPPMSAYIEGRMREARLHHGQPIEVTVAAVPVAPSSPATSDLAAQLERLGELHRQGVLSDEEFTAAKQRVLIET